MNTKYMTPMEQTQTGLSSSREWGNIPSRLLGEMNRLFDRFGFWPTEASGQFIPRVEIAEDEKSFHIDAELPGVEKDDIDLTMTGDSLIIKGKKEDVEHKKVGDIACSERVYGEFSRVVSLPENVDLDHIEAVYLNGVLCISLPKIEGQKSFRKIQVNSTESTVH